MHLPVPREVAAAVQQFAPRSPHPGLFLDRYLDWPNRWQIKGEDIKDRWQKIGQAIANLDQDVYEHLHRLQRQLLADLSLMYPLGQTVTLTLITTAPLVIGLGANTPLENGFTLHPLWGVPYIPATGVKGVLRHYLEEKYADDLTASQARKLAEGFFGSQDKAGRLLIFDAFPAHKLSYERHVRLDILNNHYPEYYQGEGDSLEVPGDFQDPVPVYFLTLGLGVKFFLRLWLKPLNGNYGEQLPGDRQLARYFSDPIVFCREALETMGLGAKTNVGYGVVQTFVGED